MPLKDFPDEEWVHIVADLESGYEDGREDEEGSQLAEIADLLSETTCMVFAWEFFKKLPELFLR